MSAAWWRRSRGSRSGGSADPPDPAKLSDAAKESLRRFLADFVHRHQLSAEETATFVQRVRERLAENDFELLRGRSQGPPHVFFAVVVERVGTEYNAERWQHWRAVAAAADRGELAGTLERLVYDEALSVEEALEAIAAKGGAADRAEAEALWEKRPLDPHRHVLDLKWQPLDDGPPPEREPTELERQLSAALRTLNAEERVILHQHLGDRIPLEGIALWQHHPPSEIAQQIARLLDRVRAELARAGVEVADLEALLADPRPGRQRKPAAS